MRRRAARAPQERPLLHERSSAIRLTADQIAVIASNRRAALQRRNAKLFMSALQKADAPEERSAKPSVFDGMGIGSCFEP